MAGLLIPILALASGAVAIRSDQLGRRDLVFVFRPLTHVLILLTALLGVNPVSPGYRLFICGGLVFSVCGDIFMMLPKKQFTPGLLCFLAALALYIVAFLPPAGRPSHPGTLLPFVILALLVFRMLSPSLGKMKLPVLAYITTITAMVWLASNRFIDSGSVKALFAFLGALLFLASDGILAYNRFVHKIRIAQILILGTYFPAQLLIALSV